MPQKSTYDESILLNRMSESRKALRNDIQDTAYQLGQSPLKVLLGLCSFLLDCFNPKNYLNGAVPEIFKDQTKMKKLASRLADSYVSDMDKRQSDSDEEWSDPLGDLYMSFAYGNGKHASGQYFTPETISSFIARFNFSGIDSEKKDEVDTVNDPCCGSGRMLLAADAQYRKHGMMRPICIGSDIDSNCCLLAALNLVMHGCRGFILCEDSLRQEFRYGYRINLDHVPGVHVPGVLVPTVVRCDSKEELMVSG